MDWLQLITNLGIFTLGSVSITGLLAFFGKKLFEQYLQAKLDDHGRRLQLISQEHQIRYSKLHNDRAEVIRNLYAKLQLMQRSMKFYIFPAQFRGEPSREEKRAKAGNAAEDFFNYFYPNEIFFDDTICKLVTEMNRLYQDAWLHATTYENAIIEAGQNADQGIDDEAIRAVMDAWKTVDTQIPPLKDKLKSLLRELLGVVSPNVV